MFCVFYLQDLLELLKSVESEIEVYDQKLLDETEKRHKYKVRAWTCENLLTKPAKKETPHSFKGQQLENKSFQILL